jgi:3-oxoacyl-[acyl-carrier protein] reductase
MDLGLAGKVALVTGGSQGIGAATTRLLVAEGACVAACARSVDALEELACDIRRQYGQDILTVRADFSNADDISNFARSAAAHFGRVDILVNSVGSSMFGSFEQVPDKQWVKDLELKLVGTVRMCRAALTYMKATGGGRIINVAGNSGKQPYNWHFPGGAANAALVNFTNALAQEVCEYGILVTAVCPGPVETRRLRKQVQALSDLWGLPTEEGEKRFYEGLPLKRAAAPEEVAQLIVFLASDRASYISGTAITIDGAISKGI